MSCNAGALADSSHVAYSGAGAGIARRFAREGYRVAVVSRQEKSLEPVVKDITSSLGQALAFTADTGMMYILY